MTSHDLYAPYKTAKYSISCIVTSLFVLFFFSYTAQNNSIIDLNKIRIEYKGPLGSKNSSLSLSSSLTYNVETTEFYPHLPIQIHTSNRNKFIKLKNKTKKIILLGNSMFDDSNWMMTSIINTTNSGNMSELSCSFLNNLCEITNDINRFKEAHAIVYHMRDTINLTDDRMKVRHPSQRFVFSLWESPANTPDIRSFNGFFNWTMTYRFNSHIFAPYYLALAYRRKSKRAFNDFTFDRTFNENIWNLHKNMDIAKKHGTVAALISNCGESSQHRWSLVHELKKYIDVTIYGKCGNPCPVSSTNETINCREYLAEHYYFILSFENSQCDDYITEKLFSIIPLPIVPVVYGRGDYTKFIPKTGFIDIREYPSIESLATRLNQITNNLTLYQSYFSWKKDFIWDRSTSLMKSFCDLCLRLHLDKTPNVINDIQDWWFNKTCDTNV